MLSTKTFKSFEITCDEASRLHKKIAAGLQEYVQLLQEAEDLLSRQMEVSKAERDTLLEMIDAGKQKLESKEQELKAIQEGI